MILNIKIVFQDMLPEKIFKKDMKRTSMERTQAKYMGHMQNNILDINPIRKDME